MSDVPALDPLLEQRRSPSVFDPEHSLTRPELMSLLEAARWSPSWGNTQPWRFLVGLRGDATHALIVETLTRGNLAWAPAASAILIGLRQVAALPDDPKGELRTYDYTAYDLGQAVAHLTVQAASLGLDVHQFAGFDHAALAATARVPDHLQPVAGIAIGRWWPETERHGVDPAIEAKEQRPRQRRPAGELVL
ncbi:nitroreductase family protein [Rudaeicoccus suwonensis]|uniref:Nitroreductase n=1 Tax=Rudaeicoccus suwonensis TaxID=657409 RepID=A0A561E3J5_9MICO|nr:nitroreductase family protein [Rudaeicoccus suwonensis]TWE10182.1 nitroreductase [Rudaeicoccus suwonensis]